MIHKSCTEEDEFMISSKGVWLPGIYDSERAARYAFKLEVWPLSQLNKKHQTINGSRYQPISFEDLKALRKELDMKSTNQISS